MQDLICDAILTLCASKLRYGKIIEYDDQVVIGNPKRKRDAYQTTF